MAVLDWLAAWPNVPFTIVLGATLLFALVQASGLIGLLAGGEAHDGHDGHDVDADADADGEDASHAGFFAQLGLGRVPITLSVQIAGAAFAATGLALNAPWTPPPISLAWTLPIALLAAYGAARLLARVLSPIVDDRLHAATARHELVGAIGTVISSKVSDEFGEIRIKDRSGHDVRVVVKLARGVRVLDAHEEAVVVDVDERGGLTVAPLDADFETPRTKKRRVV